MTQTPQTGDFLLKWRGDTLKVTLRLDSPRPGRAAFRTNIGHARVRRREIIAETERGETPLAKAWTDIPLEETAPGVFSAEISLDEVGVISGKACFFPKGSSVPEWPDGTNTHIKVESAEIRNRNSIYTVFPRQFGSFREVARVGTACRFTQKNIQRFQRIQGDLQRFAVIVPCPCRNDRHGRILTGQGAGDL